MDPTEFPPNNSASKEGRKTDKKIVPITTGTRRKQSLRKQFSETFVGGSFRSSLQYVLFDVLLPSARDMIVDAGSQGLERLIFGDSRRRGSTAPSSGGLGHIQYNRMTTASRLSGPQRELSRQARSRHNFDELIIPTRADAEEVIDQLFELVSIYDVATVADLYDLVGLDSAHTDHKWGWLDLQGARASRTRGGYMLVLPEPGPIE